MIYPPPRYTVQIAIAKACEVDSAEFMARFGIDRVTARQCYHRNKTCVDEYVSIIKEFLPMPNDPVSTLCKPDFTLDFPIRKIEDFNVQLAIGTIASFQFSDYDRMLGMKPSAVSKHRSRHSKLYENACETAMVSVFQTVGEMIPIFRMYSINYQSELATRWQDLTTPRPEQLEESNSRLYRYKHLFAEQLRLGADEAHKAGQVLGILLANRALDTMYIVYQRIYPEKEAYRV